MVSIVQRKLLDNLKTPELFNKIQGCLERIRLQNNNLREINQIFREGILTLSSFNELLKEFEEFHNSMSIWKLLKANPARLKFRQFIKNPEINDQNLYQGLLQVANYRSEENILRQEKIQSETLFKEVTGSALCWQTIHKTIEEVQDISFKAKDAPVPEDWLQKLAELEPVVKQKMAEIIGRFVPEFGNLLIALQHLLGLDLVDYFNVNDLLEISLSEAKAFLRELYNIASYIGKARLLNKDFQTITELGLRDFLNKIEPLPELSDRVGEVFENSFHQMWKSAYEEQHSKISSFIREEQDRHCKEFAKADEKLLKIAPQYVSAQILNRIDNEIKIFAEKKSFLISESKRIRNFFSIRKLLLKLEARFALALKPCLIISPMQVAEHLPLEYPPFDMVIFDEASQVEPACAISALRRSKQWLIIGDSKQMPPSQAAGVVTVDFEEEDSEATNAAELESILDECTRCLSNIYWLSWHYRSKDERLISFSNQKFYEGNLVTFPGADDGGGNFGIVYKKVIGYCGSKVFNPQIKEEGTNLVEAEYIVNFVLEKIRDEQQKKRSYGVIASNEAQAGLLRKFFEEKLTPVERSIFWDEEGKGLKTTANGTYEPIWVKSLENVQGDERDVVLLSTGFSAIREGQTAPDPGGKKISNFGKLMRAGAERRLNVALTRAREQMVIVTSMHSSDISEGCNNLGPKYLKEFLSFLELESQKSSEMKEHKPKTEEQLRRLSPIVREITRKLQERGYQVENNLGYSSYKIEIAVKDDQNSGRYLLAIETDGEVYQKAASSRDRDILRPAILKVFGWGDLYRVWLLEYLKSPEIEFEKIIAAIEAARERPIRSPAFSNKYLPETPDQVIEDASDTMVADDKVQNVTTANEPAEIPLFKMYVPFSVEAKENKEIFDKEENTFALCEILYKVIQHESPLTTCLLKDRIREIFGYSRFGAKMEKRLKVFLSGPEFNEKMAYEKNQDTIWDRRSLPAKNIEPRIADNKVRKFDQTPFAEICAGTKKALEILIAAEHETLIAETRRAFGLSQAYPAADDLIKAAIDQLVKDNYCINDNGVIRIHASES
ncbi:MAG: AAA domain-containing protein [Candidatus Riflebacteria bacterium]